MTLSGDWNSLVVEVRGLVMKQETVTGVVTGEAIWGQTGVTACSVWQRIAVTVEDKSEAADREEAVKHCTRITVYLQWNAILRADQILINQTEYNNSVDLPTCSKWWRYLKSNRWSFTARHWTCCKLVSSSGYQTLHTIVYTTWGARPRNRAEAFNREQSSTFD